MLSLNNRKLILIIILILIITFSASLFIIIDKPNIEEATFEQLEEINGIGDILATRVLSYIDSKEDVDIEDLEEIKGIGPKRLKIIKEVFE